eukprot:8833083-Lingulodinium_polyedra.AAC.1
MAGAVICETTARRWNGGRTARPHCAQADEDAEHRFWRRPRWGEVRRAAAPGCDARALRARLSDGQARAGLRPADPALLAFAQVAVGVDPDLPPVGVVPAAEPGTERL